MTVVALVPARSGSRGIPGKNVRSICGKPLLAWSVLQAREAASVDRVVVSTDARDYAATARRYGAETPFIRPAVLAADDVTTRQVENHLLHYLNHAEGARPEILVTLHPTQPLRTPDDIDGAVSTLMAEGADEVRSVTEPATHPFRLYRNTDDGLVPYVDEDTDVPRQQFSDLWADNGAVWVRRNPLLDGGTLAIHGDITVAGYWMPPERSVDIDTELDWRVAEMLMRERHQRERAA